MRTHGKSNISPWAWVPTLYFAEGIPFIFVYLVSIVPFTQLGMSETDAAFYTGLLYLPWVIKPIWSPIVDIIRTKRWWIVIMQFCVAIGLAGIALTLPKPTSEEISAGVPVSAFALALVFYFFTAMCSATNDISSDGYYMLALDSQKQSLFVGIRSTFYRCANVFGQGGLMIIAGMLEITLGIALGWTYTVGFCALFFLVMAIYHWLILPYPPNDRSVLGYEKFNDIQNIFKEFTASFITFFKKKHILSAILFMLLYRLPEAQVIKLCKPFLLADRDMGGLGLSQAQVGFVYGTLAIIGLTIGGIIGGVCASRGGLKKWIFPMALITSLNCISYIILSVFQPDYEYIAGRIIIYICVIFEQFAYGFGFTAFMLFLMYFSEGEFKTSHYAICTAFMALGMMLPGMAAGWIKEVMLGNSYVAFFFWVLACNIATWAVTLMVRPHISKFFGVKK